MSNKKRIIFIVEGQNEMDYTLERRQKEERKLSIKTENNYQRQYNYLTDLFKQSNKYWVVRSSIKDLYEKIKSLNCQPSTKLGYLNIFIIIKKCYNCKFDLLDNLRNELMNEKKKEVKPTINKVMKPKKKIKFIIVN
jgi:hypothetical protein